jgi:hypothetical protein
MAYQQRPLLEVDSEIHKNILNRFRAFLSSRPEFLIEEPTQDHLLMNKREFVFPHAAIDWNSLVVLNHQGDFTRELFTQGTWQPRLRFKEPQIQEIRIRSYQRSQFFVLTEIQDFPGDLEKSFEPSQYSGDFEFPLVVVPLADLSRGNRELESQGDVYFFSGTIAIYTSRSLITPEQLRQKAELIVQSFQIDRKALTYHGIRSLSIRQVKLLEFAGFMECSIDFQASVLVNLQEDHYWNIPY